jgi:hypothetical protein
MTYLARWARLSTVLLALRMLALVPALLLARRAALRAGLFANVTANQRAVAFLSARGVDAASETLGATPRARVFAIQHDTARLFAVDHQVFRLPGRLGVINVTRHADEVATPGLNQRTEDEDIEICSHLRNSKKDHA